MKDGHCIFNGNNQIHLCKIWKSQIMAVEMKRFLVGFLQHKKIILLLFVNCSNLAEVIHLAILLKRLIIVSQKLHNTAHICTRLLQKLAISACICISFVNTDPNNL